MEEEVAALASPPASIRSSTPTPSWRKNGRPCRQRRWRLWQLRNPAGPLTTSVTTARLSSTTSASISQPSRGGVPWQLSGRQLGSGGRSSCLPGHPSSLSSRQLATTNPYSLTLYWHDDDTTQTQSRKKVYYIPRSLSNRLISNNSWLIGLYIITKGNVVRQI